MIVILHLVDMLEFARMVFINPLPEASNIRLLEYDSNFKFEQFILRRVIVVFSRENTQSLRRQAQNISMTVYRYSRYYRVS